MSEAQRGGATREGDRPTLVVLAAGMGSRFGGPKQLEPVGPHGETIMEYGIFDALRAGFGDVVIITRPELEGRIREVLDARAGRRAPIRYVRQLLEDLPAGFTLPAERSKPWGTGHAVLCAEPAVSRPFAVVNADDFYGARSYRLLGAFLDEGRAAGGGGRDASDRAGSRMGARAGVILSDSEGSGRRAPEPDPSPTAQDDSNATTNPHVPRDASRVPRPAYCVVGFPLGETLSDEGGVNRARLDADAAGWLEHTAEIKGIERRGAGAAYRDGNGREQPLALDQQVSMNMWGFTPAFFAQLRDGFVRFLEAHRGDPKAEYLLPGIVQELIAAEQARVRVLPGGGPWCGVTYPQDKPMVTAEIAALVARGEYPSPLWG